MFIHQRIISAVKKVEFISNRMPYIVLELAGAISLF